jgi:hypothetical protein
VARDLTRNDAIAYENATLSIGREFLPAFAQAVLDDNTAEPAPEYWAWLSASAAEAQAESAEVAS